MPRWDQRYSDREVKASGVKGKPVEVSRVKDESDLPMDRSFLSFAVKPSNHEKRARWSTAVGNGGQSSLWYTFTPPSFV